MATTKTTKQTKTKAKKPTQKLVIVESPAKAKTINKYLGSGYRVVASMGHVRDLPVSTLGVDIENDFTPKYINIRKQSQTIKDLKAEAKKSGRIFLATDPDREGEAISWHLAQLFGLDLEDANRVTFNEITKNGIKTGMAAPRKIDMDLVDAQQARRVLDRLVGYQISPFLWKKVRNGLSAGRVQSVVVSLIVQREEEIRHFVPREYWSIDAKFRTDLDKSLTPAKRSFQAKLYGKDGKELELSCEAEANEVLQALENASYTVDNIKLTPRVKHPAPPFITSTLQQEASRKLGFQSRRTMKAAQELYEGVDVKDHGTMGLITYMRTDSLRLSSEAKAAAKEVLLARYGENYLPETERVYKSRSNAQDGHEAIRPTTPSLTPAEVQDSLTPDQFKIYKLVWERFMASQMADAVLLMMQVTIGANDYQFRATGHSVLFDGFTILYEEGRDDNKKEEGALPPLAKGETLTLLDLKGNQHFTTPPPRYTEASLIKTLEENGIGRPSTYAPTISTILARDYVKREKKQLVPTSLGEAVNALIQEHFHELVEVNFTAQMESELDRVEHGEIAWKDTIREFYKGFSKDLAHAEETIGSEKIVLPDEVTDIICEKCGRNMVIKSGRYGKFLACPGYPECKNTKKIVVETEGNCPKCGKRMHEQKSKKGKIFYGCSGYPACDFMTWDLPVAKICPKCGKTMFKKSARTGGYVCLNEACGYEEGEKNG